MRFPPDTLAAIADGRVDRAFRRWERPRVRAGGRQRTAIGVIGFEAVEPTTREELTEEDARRSGIASLGELLRFLDRRTIGTIYRIRLRLVGADPRVALRETLPDEGELADIERRLARLDRASTHGPWTRAVLETVRDHPEVRAADLAPRFGRERLAFKADVRRLKELGLTESLEVGYRLSPRGRAFLEWLDTERGVARD
jgi:hypothetical protein